MILPLQPCVSSQITHTNRQKKHAKIVADLTKEPEPYLEPRHHHQQQQAEEVPVFEAASASKEDGFGGDVGMMGNRVMPMPGSIYADLGRVEPVTLISFAYQIASGLVNNDYHNYSQFVIVIYMPSFSLV